MMWIGIDTGGTFTDFVVYDGRNVTIHKVLSTPEAPEKAILTGISRLGINLENNSEELYVIHGSTVGTNAVLEGKGVRTAFITNRGLRDILSIGRQARRELYQLQPRLDPPPVPPELCLEVSSRISADGTELEPLTNEDLRQLRQAIETLAPQAVAINLLFSFLNERHEQTIEAIIPKEMFVSRSSKILPEYREYERGMATWLNAWIGPIMERYLFRLKDQLGTARISVMQSSGGTIDITQAGALAVNLLLSGPAGGLAGAQYIARYAGRDRLLTFDMGGTSTDVALVDGIIQLTNEGFVGPYPVAVPMVDMHTIGAGGGSIAYIDTGGLLQVGPRSAGGKYFNYISPLECKFNAEIFKKSAGMKRSDVNEIVKQIIPKYEDKLRNPPKGKSFTECYDIKTLKPTQEWLDIYLKVKKEAIDLGIPLDYP